LSPIYKRIIRGASGTLFFTVVSALAAFIQLRWMLHYLSVQDAGIWILFLALGNYIAFFDLGISPTLGREISFALGAGGTEDEKQGRIADLLATCTAMFRILSVAAFFLCTAIGSGFILMFTPPGSRAYLLSVWLIFSAGASLNLLGSTGFAALFGIGCVATEKTVRGFTLLIGLAASLAGLSLGMGLLGLALAWSFQGLLARYMAWRRFYALMPSLRSHVGTASLLLARKLAIPSLKLAGVQLGSIVILQSSSIVIALSLGSAAIPPYEALVKISATLMTLSLMLVLSSVPFVSQAHAADDPAAVRQLLLHNLRFGMASLLTLAIYVAVFGEQIVTLWLGVQNFAGERVLWSLLIMTVLEVHHIIYSTALFATGRITFVGTAMLAALLTVVLSLALAKELHLWGIALGTLFAQLLTNNWYAPYVTIRTFGIPLGSLLREVYVPIGAMSILIILLDLQLRARVPSSGPQGLIVTFAASCLGAILFFFFVVLRSGERESLRTRLRLVRA
jgi:O-antigen/teichoic acid export membrane protein